MFIYLSKILPLFVLPIGLVLELSFIALLFVLGGKKKTSAVFIFLAMAVLWTASTPYVANTLLGVLERDYPAVMMTEVPRSKCIVVLGGTVEPVLSPRVDIDMLEAADRVRKAAQLFRADLGKVIIVTGGNQPWSPFAESEARAMKTLLLEWDVPASAILLEDNSRNTRENAFNSLALLERQACGAPLLVTSAAHMKRSVAVFENLGVEVYPVSADVRVIDAPEFTLFDFLPDAKALVRTNDAMREWIGQWFYEFWGWG